MQGHRFSWETMPDSIGNHKADHQNDKNDQNRLYIILLLKNKKYATGRSSILQNST